MDQEKQSLMNVLESLDLGSSEVHTIYLPYYDSKVDLFLKFAIIFIFI